MPRYRPQTNSLPDTVKMTRDQRRDAMQEYAVKNKIASKVDPRFAKVNTVQSRSAKRSK
jgi:hypothetical protein